MSETTERPVRIVIGPRGWVWVGYYSREGEDVTLTSARCIRRWGTTQGLGELATGPTSQTTLDKAGTVRIPAALAITYDADAAGWAAALD